MAIFKDNAQREWKINLDAPIIREVRQQCMIDLADIEGRGYEKLIADPVLLVDCLWVICREQASRLPTGVITDAQFGAGLTGDAIELATAAMLEAIADFFPTRSRALLRKVGTISQEIREAGIEKALAKISDPGLKDQFLASLDLKIDQALNSLIQSTSVTSSQALSDSVPKA